MQVVDKIMFTGTVFALDKMVNALTFIYPEFKEELSKKNLKVQLKLRDNSFGRLFIIKDGRITGRFGIYDTAQVVMTFQDWEIARKLTSPVQSKMDFVNAAKNGNVSLDGPDEDASWFSALLLKVFAAPIVNGHLYGKRMKNGEIRYVNGSNSGIMYVYVKDGKIVRTTPLELDETDAEPWTIKAKGHSFTPPKRTTLSTHSTSVKSLVYSPDRLLYPMKRVDFDPDGERNYENRGVSGYERISWDEAYSIVSNEIIRCRREHGPGSIFHTSGSHHTWGNIGYYLSAGNQFFNAIGATMDMRNPDSWEGFFWGATHHYGGTARNGGCDMFSLVEDCMQNSEMIVFWSSDPESTSGVYAGQDGTIRREWLKKLGITCVHIDPYFNESAAFTGGRWIAPNPGTDTAMALAIAYVWIKEGLYDKDYVATRTHGFDVWKDYIMGVEDGVPKTPAWQEAETGVPARVVDALAREWASKKTYLASGGAHSVGSACRTAYGHEWARAMVCLVAMQGLGKPGVNFSNLQAGTPVDSHFYFPGYAEGGFSGDMAGTGAAPHMYNRMPMTPSVNTCTQKIPRVRIPEAIMEKKTEAFRTHIFTQNDQFIKCEYPAPGYVPVKMYYKYGGSHIGTQPNSNRFVKMYRCDSLEFVVNQSIWFEGEAKFADIILPACTNLERWDIAEHANCGGYVEKSYVQSNHRIIHIQHKCIEPLGESKSDFQIFSELADYLGLGQVYSEGSTEFDWCKRLFDATDLPNVISWGKFLRKGYYVVPPLPEDRRDPVSWRWFYEGRKRDVNELTPLPSEYTGKYGYGLQTQTGLFEFESSSLKRAPEGDERKTICTYIPSWEGRSSEDYAKYPLQLISPHPRYSFHTMMDAKRSAINEIDEHRVKINGYYYWVLRMSPEDAKKRGLKHHDIVEAYNDRGSVLCALCVSSRLREGTVHSFESAIGYDPIGEPGHSPDRGGCINILTPNRHMSKNAHGIAPNSCLIEVRKWNEKESVKA